MQFINDLLIVGNILENDKKLNNISQTALKVAEFLKNSTSLPILNIILELIKQIDDNEITYIHSLEVGILSVHFQNVMEEHLNTKLDSEKLIIGGLIHDVGKIKIPIHILNKTSSFNKNELNIIRRHPNLGKDVAFQLGLNDNNILDIIEQHHENVEGTGYYKMKNINPYALSINVADQFSAISQKRQYKASRTKEETLKIMIENKTDINIINKIS